MDIKSNRKLLDYLNGKVISVIAVLGWLLFNLYTNIEGTNNKRSMMIFVVLIGVLLVNLLIDELNKILLLNRLNKAIEIIDKDENEMKAIKDFNKGGMYNLLNKNEVAYKNIDLIIESSKKAKVEREKGEMLSHLLINNATINLKKPVRTLLDESLGLIGKKSNDITILDTLENETQDIKILIDTLFEGSKIIAGVVESEKIGVDINYVLRQCLMEIEGELERNNLILDKFIDNDKNIIMANPEQLWRVFQILIENIIKHSMAGTRVYVETKSTEGTYKIVMKNIARERLNLTIEELYKQIKLKENSTGLQLEIVKCIIKSFGGEFNIFIDGDLFKTEIILNEIVIEEMSSESLQEVN